MTACISFIITVVLAVLIFAKLQIYPGGKFTMLTYDLAMHDLPYIASIRYIGSKDCSFWYSMFGGLGSNYMASYAYYIACPLNILTVFVPLEKLPYAIYFLTLFKLGMCSATFAIYVLYGLRQSSYRYLLILLSVAFGMSSYSLFYSFNLMWLDGLVFLPLIILGLEELMRGKKGLLYLIALTASLYMDYYITYMSGIFAFIYLIYRLMVADFGKTKVKRILLSYIVLSLASLGLSMPLLFPTLKYMMIGAINNINPIDHFIRVTPLRIIRNLFPMGEFFMLNEGAPQLFCGTITIILIILFFISKRITRKEKLIVLTVFMIYFISFLLVPVDRAWHGFRDPTCIPARYSFTCIFFMLSVACRALRTDSFSVIHSRITNLSWFIHPLICIFVISELYMNGSLAIMEVNANSCYTPYDEYYHDITSVNSALDGISDDGLYRTASPRFLTSADGYLFGFNDVSYFSSAYDSSLHDQLKKLGFYNKRHAVTASGITPVTANIFGVRYMIGCDGDYYDSEHVSGNSPHSIFKNSEALPIGFLVSTKSSDISDSDNPFINQEKMLSSMLDKHIELFADNDYQISDKDDGKYARSCNIDLTLEQDGPVWLYFPLGNDTERAKYDIDTTKTPYNRDAVQLPEYKCVINDSATYDIMMNYSPYCIYAGEHKSGERLAIYAYSTTYFSNPYIVTMNTSEYKLAFAELAQYTLKVTAHGNGMIEGTVSGTPGRKLVLSLPYMDGYSVYVDGIKTAYARYNPAMISVDIQEGEHNIRISYLPPGLAAGCVIGILSLAVSIQYMRTGRKEDISQA